MKTILPYVFGLVAIFSSVNAADNPVPQTTPKPAAPAAPKAVTVPASDPLFLGSVLDETWDVSHAKQGHIDCMMSLSDVDLSVVTSKSGPVVLNFDSSVYAPNQAASAGPIWKFQVDDGPFSDRITIGPKVTALSTPSLSPGTHRVRFVNCANTNSPRWNANDPQLSRVTGVTLPEGAHLDKSARASHWFLPITDSIGEGAVDMNATTATFRQPNNAYTDSTCAWVWLAAQMLHESVAGYVISGIGIVRAGTGVPCGALNLQGQVGQDDPWDHIFAGVPRPFTTAPDFILLCVGTNEWATDPQTEGHAAPGDPTSSDAGFAANVQTFFARVRDHAQLASTPIYVSVPFGGYKRTALQKAIAGYRAAHPDEKHIELFDLAFGSPALTTTDGVDEGKLFSGLTKNRPDDTDTKPSPQASDRTHPYGMATPAISSVNAHQQIAQVMAARLGTLLKGGPAPQTGELEIGKAQGQIKDGVAQLECELATGGSAPYWYQFQTSADNGVTWTALGDRIESMATTIEPLTISNPHPAAGTLYRVMVTDTAAPAASAHTPPITAN